MKKSVVLFAFVFLIIVCGFMPDLKPQTLTKTLISEPDNEGYVLNSKPRTFFPYNGGGQKEAPQSDDYGAFLSC